MSSLLGGFAVALLLHPPKSDDKNGQEMFKKCSTDQRFIRKRNTTYEIGTLVIFVERNKKKLVVVTTYARAMWTWHGHQNGSALF